MVATVVCPTELELPNNAKDFLWGFFSIIGLHRLGSKFLSIDIDAMYTSYIEMHTEDQKYPLQTLLQINEDTERERTPDKRVSLLSRIFLNCV